MRGSRRPSSFLKATQALRASWTRWLQTRLQRKLTRVERRRELLLLEADHLQVRQEELRLRMLPLEVRQARLRVLAADPFLPTPQQAAAAWEARGQMHLLPGPPMEQPRFRPEQVMDLPQVLFPTPEPEPEPEPEEQPPPADQQVWEALKHPS